MANSDCIPQVHIVGMRLSELDPTGVPTPGSDTLIAVDSIVEIQATPVVTTGAEIEEPNGQGAICINYKAPDTLKRFDLSLIVCDHNPYVMRALGRGVVLESGGVRGYGFPALGPTNEDGLSIEFWAKRIDQGALHAEYPYAWWVMPLVTNLAHGPMTWNNGANRPTFTGRAFENDNWFDGPLNDWPVESDRALQWFPVPELPDFDCAPQALLAS